MRNYLTIGPVNLRISRKHIAPWGYPFLKVHGFEMLCRDSAGGLTLASYQPASGGTWHWAISLARSETNRGWIRRAKMRRGQWHDYYRLPFNREIRVSRQDYHLRRS